MSPTARQIADEIAADPSFAEEPAFVICGIVSRAATAHAGGRRDHARALTHAACLLAVAAANPAIARGASLDALVRVYGDGSGS